MLLDSDNYNVSAIQEWCNFIWQDKPFWESGIFYTWSRVKLVWDAVLIYLSIFSFLCTSRNETNQCLIRLTANVCLFRRNFNTRNRGYWMLHSFVLWFKGVHSCHHGNRLTSKETDSVPPSLMIVNTAWALRRTRGLHQVEMMTLLDPQISPFLGFSP